MAAELKSQICTTVEQSDRLLDLGLNPETADMHYLWAGYWHLSLEPWEQAIDDFPFDFHSEEEQEDWKLRHRPAWSLHRLIEMMPKNIAIDGDTAYPLQIQKRSDGKWCVGYQGWYDCVGDLYDSVIWIYQLLISEGYLDEFCNKG